MQNKNVAKVIIDFFKHNILLSVALIVTIVGVVVVSLIPPQILRHIVDNYLSKGLDTNLVNLAVIYFVVLIFIGLFDFLKAVLLTVCGQKITHKLRYEMIQKKNKLSSEYFTINGTGTIVSRIMNDVEQIQSLFTNGIISMVIDLFKIIGIVVSIWLFSAELGFIVLVIIPVIYVITRMFQKRMLKAQITNRKLIAKVNNHIPESINNMEMIKSFCKEDLMQAKYKQYLNDSYESMEKVNFYDSIFSPIILIIKSVVIALMVILSSDSINILGISVGMVAAAIDLISNLFSPIESLGMELQSIQQAVAGVKRVNEFLGENEIVDKNASLDTDSLDIDSITLDDVHFRYKSADFDVINGISLSINPKENVTFAGRTGAGKSTLFKLILGLLEPTSGRVMLGNINVNDIPNSQKRKIFGYVEQSFHFVKGNIAEQISLGDENITKDDIIRAIKFVGLHDYVMNLENGYETKVDKSLFSQGQCQLLSIARAIVSNPKIIMLDEITANLDSETEEKIITVLQEATSDRTLLSISHRLSAILNCDKVITIKDGMIEK